MRKFLIKLVSVISIFALSFGFADFGLAYQTKLQSIFSYTVLQGDVPSAGYGLAFSDDWMWMSQYATDRIHRFTKTGIYTGFSFSTAPTSTAPYGIAFDGTYLWISDNDNDEVYRYTEAGVYTGVHWDTAAAGAITPTGLTFDGTYFWVYCRATDRVYRYNSSGVYTSYYINTAAFGMTSGYGLTWTGSKICATDASADGIFCFTTSGMEVTFVGTTTLGADTPRGIGWYNNYLFITDLKDHKIYRVSTVYTAKVVSGKTVKFREKQLLSDGDMEATAITGLWGVANGATLSKRAGGAKTGNRILRITSGGSAAGNAYYLGTITGGQRYHVTGYARGDGTNHPRVMVAIGTSCWIGTTSTEWQHFDCVYNGTAGYPLRLVAYSATASTYVEFDQIYFTEY
jgi:hypothetical protein